MVVWERVELDELVGEMEGLSEAVEERVEKICREEGWELERVRYTWESQVTIKVEEAKRGGG